MGNLLYRLSTKQSYLASKSLCKMNHIHHPFHQLDLEPINCTYSDKRRRIKRGLFETSYGIMKSDINGSLNILRKYVKDKNILRLINDVWVQ